MEYYTIKLYFLRVHACYHVLLLHNILVRIMLQPVKQPFTRIQDPEGKEGGGGGGGRVEYLTEISGKEVQPGRPDPDPV